MKANLFLNFTERIMIITKPTIKTKDNIIKEESIG